MSDEVCALRCVAGRQLRYKTRNEFTEPCPLWPSRIIIIEHDDGEHEPHPICQTHLDLLEEDGLFNAEAQP